MQLPVINAVWIGSRLGPVHAACLRSFVRHGHKVVLHVYGRPEDAPDGVELANAEDLLPGSRIVRYSRGGSPAIFANLLRYELLKKGLGLYVDCDCYCLRPIENADYIFGYEATGFINNAVLKLPQDCPVLEDLCRLKDARRFIPPWAGEKWKMYYTWRARLGMAVKIQDMPWGYTGPFALTWYLKEHGLDQYAAPIDHFYPVHAGQTALLLDPELRIEDITTRRTRLLHLSNEKLKGVDIASVPPSSPLGTILASN